MDKKQIIQKAARLKKKKEIQNLFKILISNPMKTINNEFKRIFNR